MFVVFEGIDGSGKTTISNMVTERLGQRSLTVTHLRAKGKFASEVTESVRELGRDARNLELVPHAEFLLYVARDVQLIEEVLKPSLDKSDIVFADRFLYTAEVLARYGRNVAAERTTPVLQAAANGLAPDLVILVDVDPKLARARRKAAKYAENDRRPPSRKGLSGVGLQHRLRKGYQELAAADSKRWVVVGNDEPLEDIVNRVTDLVERAFRSGTESAIRKFKDEQAAARSKIVPPEPIRSAEEAFEALLRWIDHRMALEPRVVAYMIAGLAGDRLDERRLVLAERAPRALLGALTGLEDEVSWTLRERLAKKYPRETARTLNGLGNDDLRAAAMREALESQAAEEVMKSQSGFDDDKAWEARERLRERLFDVVVGSVRGLDSDRAWKLRDAWLKLRADEIGDNYEVARVAVKCVSGIAGDRAWKIRRAAWKAAPVAVLGSISGLDDAESWSHRENYLERAPKVIMGTLRGSTDPRAWQMRRAVAERCKEALDSIIAMDAPEAWQMRESYLDVWPSTVVKTLGPLARTQRGEALTARQLLTYPDNVSLLKHVAGVVLGAYRTLPKGDT